MPSKVLPLGKYRKYNAYQAAFDVCASGADIGADERFCKTVLIITKWLKDRYAKRADKEGGSRALEALEPYPDPDGYAGFDLSGIGDAEVLDEGEIRICCHTFDNEGEETLQWALRIDEPGLEHETFITDVTVVRCGGRVTLAVRGAVKIPTDHIREVSFYRPAFIRNMVKDEELCITEAGTDKIYCFGPGAIHINGKSNTECSDFREGFLDNPSRQLPVFFVSQHSMEELGGELAYSPKPEPEPEETEAENEACGNAAEGNAEDGNASGESASEEGACAEKVAEENVPDENEKPQRNIVDAAAYASMGYAHIIVVDGSTRKLFAGGEYDSYADRLDKGEFVMLGSEPEDRDYGAYFEIDDKMQMIGTFMSDMRHMMERFPYDFGGIDFYTELRIRKREDELRDMLTGGGENIDPAKLIEEVTALRDVIATLRAEKDQEDEDHKSEITQLKSENEKLKGKLDKQKNYSESLKEQQLLLKEEKQALSDKVDEATSKEADEKTIPQLTAADYISRNAGILNPPARYQKDMLIGWIDEYYKDTIILHNRARHSIESLGTLEESRCRIIVAMIHYLHGCTLYWNEGNNDFDSDKSIMQEYVPYNYVFEIAPVGNSSIDAYKSSYQLDVSEYDDKAGVVYMKQHIKYGKGFGDDPSMVRLYYYYDSDIKKSIIGELPNHLPTYSGGR